MSDINQEISEIREVNEITTICQETNPFDFIKDPEKLKLLIKANELLRINKSNHLRLIFVYSAPKVGSTSIVSCLRIFGSNKVNVIHIHDEEMLKVLSHIQNVTVNELILFNKFLGKDVYVINIYRSPIERKISTFFEKIGSYHFNTEDLNINHYSIVKVINRFNNIFPYLGLGDYFMDKYNIIYPDKFDHTNKYILVKENDISYIGLRLKDSDMWGYILSKIFGFNIHTIKDYESDKKPIKDLYKQFKMNYRIPKNYLDDIITCKHLNYYYTQEEIVNYYNEWYNNSSFEKQSYSLEEYKFYEKITIENSHFDHIQFDHYMDEGCVCKACNLKRMEIASKIIRRIPVTDRLLHTESRIEFLEKRVLHVNRINQAIHNIPKKVRDKDFKNEMSNLVRGRHI